MKKMIKDRKGFHLWERETGSSIGWTGYMGIRVCKKCGAQWETTQESSTDPETHDWMKDCFGKRIPKKDWLNCPK